ncbi:ESCRT-II complex, vps25 subunit [Polychaeton citri CBS 116435]|uniref:ESCRT-II complex subunit VPS25 n=1 Tax=Polychaeton citri CBS 116435 TaxID=1314669 RepID=A0A9P4ULE3_9PEZI|nr:ESCRT-II complex, vps25 subunit [Polychaeton citri CBS 116435]
MDAALIARQGAVSPVPSSTFSTATTLKASTSSFSFPSPTSYPPFYTLQPNLTTRAKQLTYWSQLVVSYAQYHRLFKLSLSTPPPGLFNSPTLPRSLSPSDIRLLLDWMSEPANGSKIEWIPAASRITNSETCWVYWKSLGEWADELYAWVVEETGQKGAVLTVYELREGEQTKRCAWYGMDEDLLKKVLQVLVKRGKVQIFGQDEEAGVKFF